MNNIMNIICCRAGMFLLWGLGNMIEGITIGTKIARRGGGIGRLGIGIGLDKLGMGIGMEGMHTMMYRRTHQDIHSNTIHYPY